MKPGGVSTFFVATLDTLVNNNKLCVAFYYYMDRSRDYVVKIEPIFLSDLHTTRGRLKLEDQSVNWRLMHHRIRYTYNEQEDIK